MSRALMVKRGYLTNSDIEDQIHVSNVFSSRRLDIHSCIPSRQKQDILVIQDISTN